MKIEGREKGKTMNIEDTDIDDEIEAAAEEPEGQETETDAAPAEDTGTDDGDIVIEIEGEEAEPAQETPAIRQLREANRAQARRIAELEAARGAPGAIEVGEKPTLESCEYDEDRYDAELTAWHERKAAAKRADDDRAEQERKSAELWNSIESNYRAAAAALKVPGFEAKEQKVDQTLPEMVRRAIKAYCAEPAKVIAALGSNDALLDRIAGEKDPIKQLVTLVKLESKMKVTRTRQIEPDKPLSGSASLAVTPEAKQLEKLEKEAARTGDRTALIAFKAKMRQKAA